MMSWQEKLKDFENFLKFERNFSDNTLDAYSRDIRKLQAYAETDLGGISPAVISFDQLQEYLYQLGGKGAFGVEGAVGQVVTVTPLEQQLQRHRILHQEPDSYLI